MRSSRDGWEAVFAALDAAGVPGGSLADRGRESVHVRDLAGNSQCRPPEIRLAINVSRLASAAKMLPSGAKAPLILWTLCTG